MTVFTEMSRLKTAIADAYIACQDMGATMPAVLNSDNLEQCIASISGGGSPATVLHLYDRVDGKGTVVGFWTDGNGTKYAVVVADAQYRSGGQKWNNKNGTNTPLPNYDSSSAALAAGESGTYNTDTVLNTYTATDYPAFNKARNATTVMIDDKTFVSCLPNVFELQMIWNDRSTIDTYDTTLTEYPSNDLTTWNIGGNSYNYCWSSNEKNANYAWYVNSSNTVGNYLRDRTYGIIPIFEIPVDENGEVQ